MALIYHNDNWAFTFGEKVAEQLESRGLNIFNDMQVIDTD